jgi:hypothetical protein
MLAECSRKSRYIQWNRLRNQDRYQVIDSGLIATAHTRQRPAQPPTAQFCVDPAPDLAPSFRLSKLPEQLVQLPVPRSP